MKKRLLAAVLAALMALTAIVVVEVWADDTMYNSGDWWYYLENGEAIILRYTGRDLNVTIPSMLDGFKVTKLSHWRIYSDSAFGVFYDCPTTSVTIPNSITVIDDYAFEECSSLTSVTIPHSVMSIGDGAFCNCYSLTNITIPDSVQYIGKSAFFGCRSLTEVSIPDSVLYIGAGAFRCSALKRITIPDTVISIGNDAFDSTAYFNNSLNWERNVLYICHHLIKAKISIAGSYSVRLGTLTIAEGAFSNCKWLTDVIIPPSIYAINNYAFSNCTALKSITIGERLSSIGTSAFYNCSSLKTINYSKSEEDWQIISIGSGNDSLYNAMILFNTIVPISPGDTNGDNTLNAKDIVAILRILTGWEDADVFPEAADYNGDGKVNARDIFDLMKAIVTS